MDCTIEKEETDERGKVQLEVCAYILTGAYGSLARQPLLPKKGERVW